MNSSEHIFVKKPSECSDAEVQNFVTQVLSGGAVTALGLESRVISAAFLVFLTQGQCLKGVAALKRPKPMYRKSVSERAGIPLDVAAFPFELGWVFVQPSARGAGLSSKLVSTALSAAPGAGVFATSRSDNTPMHRTLEHLSFIRVGCPYESSRSSHQIQLFIRPAN